MQTLRRVGDASRVGDGTWLIKGTVDQPTTLILLASGDLSRMELVLATAEKLMARCPEPPSLILADPPWGLGIQSTGRPERDAGERLYARNPERVVGGYRDFDPGRYAEFSECWIRAAAALLPMGGYLAIVTGPGQSVRAGGGRGFRVDVPQPDHHSAAPRIGDFEEVQPRTQRRHRHVPRPGQPAGKVLRSAGRSAEGAFRAGLSLDVWNVGKHERRNLVRYPTMLHPAIPARLIGALTRGDDNGGAAWESLVVDPFVGGGETAVAAWRLRRRFFGGDINPRALRLTAARVSAES